MKKDINLYELVSRLGSEASKMAELSLWWDNYKIFMNKGDIKTLFLLLDKLVLNADYVRNKKYRSYSSEYYDVVVHVLKMAKEPINNKA
jgi:hypothetical protein